MAQPLLFQTLKTGAKPPVRDVGGNIEHAMAAAPRAVAGRFRVTEQGDESQRQPQLGLPTSAAEKVVIF